MNATTNETGREAGGAERYAYSNQSDHARTHHEALAALLNADTTSRIRALLDLTGARCLDVGGGAGSVADWLAGKVGPIGRVTVTDLDPGLISDPHPRVQVVQHDVTTDDLPDPGRWTLIHARLLLGHLPERRPVLRKLVAALASGGWLLLEEWRSQPPEHFVAFAPTARAAELLRGFHRAHQAHLIRHGYDRDWPTSMHTAIRNEGLIDVRTTVSADTWAGGRPGTRMLGALLDHIREELIRHGAQPADLDEVARLLTNPDVALHGHHLYASSARKPA